MSNEHHHTEFEQWLREETDRHRLYADESVWERIQNRLRRRRWLPFVLTALVIISACVTWVMMDQPDLPINYASRTANLPTKSASQQNPSIGNTQTESKIATPYRNAQNKPEESSLTFLIQASAEAGTTTDAQTYTTEFWAVTGAAEPIRPEPTRLSITTPVSVSSIKPIVPVNTRIDPSSIATVISETNPSTPIEENATDREIETAAWLPEQIQTIESVINNYKGKRTRKSWKVQLSVSPTISYRHLIENATALQAARSLMSPAPALAAPELETVVDHKPDMGLQFGLLANRRLTKNVDLIAGLQFNINKYDIRAYHGSREVATVGLNNGGGTGSVSSFTNYRSSGGAWANWLANFYFSVSAPIGFQYQVAGNKKWSWGIGSTLQPTYMLSNRAYILSTDYKNYLEVPSLVRRWNLNGQLETFIGFQRGKTRWTLGPQARYQILSSYEKAYPVSEHLFDVGIKLGVGL
jgi:hypothetical protein